MEDVYRLLRRKKDRVAAMHGDLPQPLRWLTANIGAHHLHHAASKIPFYRLPEVLHDHPAELRDGAARIPILRDGGQHRVRLELG